MTRRVEKSQPAKHNIEKNENNSHKFFTPTCSIITEKKSQLSEDCFFSLHTNTQISIRISFNYSFRRIQFD